MTQATLSFVRALVQRAQNEGARRVELNVKDLAELLPFVESGMHKALAAQPLKTAGWAAPRDLQSLSSRGPGDRAIRMRRFKSDAYNTELYYKDDLGTKVRESDAARLARESTEPPACEQPGGAPAIIQGGRP